MRNRFARLSVVVFFFISSFAGFFANSPTALAESKRKSVYDAVADKDKERPDLRDRWMMRGRSAARGQSAALRLKAYQQKLAMREAARLVRQRDKSAGAGPDGGSIPWVALGPAPLISDQDFYGAVAGRVAAVAIDPSDSSGNTVYVAAASGGVWKSTNAANPTAASVTWSALTDQQASLVNGAVSVKANGSVVLVGTGEPNNAVDSYYGVGMLRSTDHGGTWTLIPLADGGTNSFAGLGFAKFAWSTAATGTVMAATGTTTQGFDDGDITGTTNRGLYLSTDSGQTWAFQIPQDAGVTISPASVSASDMVYNAAAAKFFAAIRYHGVYSSTNGQNWTRLPNQPNPTELSTGNCPAQILNSYSTCPIYRGQLAVVPGRNEMYFWFVSIASDGGVVDEGIWRSVNGGSSWTQIDETGIPNCGDPANIGCGVDLGYYNLEIAAVPDGQATDLYAGAVNLFKCKLPNNTSTNCSTIDSNFPNQWINLTHAYGCSSIASVHPDHHGLDFMTVSGKGVMYFGNDGGIYRSLDGFTQLNSGTCGVANGFDNLNASSVSGGTIGSLTQFVSFSLHPTDQNTVLGGTQGNGSPGTASATGSLQWTTVNGGDGGYNAINAWTPTTWYTANTDVNIYMCPSGINCTTDEFSLTVGNEEVGGDSGAYYTPYILDPQDPDEMLVGTCRVWRGAPTVPPSSFSPLSVDFDTLGSNTCTGQEINLVSGLAAGGPRADFMSTTVYATTEGTGPNATAPWGGEVWVTTNAGIEDMAQLTGAINPSHYTISSVAVDASDATGATSYVGIMGFGVSHVFKTANAGASWTDWSGSGSVALPDAPVNALFVDSSAHVVYAGTDVGVFVSSTTSASWAEMGTAPAPGATGYLPNVPVTAIRMFNSGGTKEVRVSTYGRGIWEYVLATGPDYTNVISNTPQTIYPGQTATFNGALTALGGYASKVNLSCTGAVPPTCNLNPAQQTPTASGATYTLTAGGPIGDYTFNAHAVGTDPQAITHDVAVTLHVVAAQVPDFTLAVTATPSATVAGQNLSWSGTLTALHGYNSQVNLSCVGTVPGTCSLSPSSLVPTAGGAAFTVTVGSATAGSFSFSVQGTDGTLTHSQAVSLTVGTDVTWSDTGSGSVTVAAGQSAIYSFTAAPVGGATFSGAVNFACANLPVQPGCSFSPASIAAGAGATSVTLTIATTGPNSGSAGPDRQRRVASGGRYVAGAARTGGIGTAWTWPMTIPIGGIFMVGVARRKTGRRGLMLGCCVAVAGLLLMAACGGGLGGSSGGGPPPQATVTVSPRSSSIYADEPGNTWPAAETQQQFSAVVNNGNSQTVTWAVSGGAANGTIDANGLYQSPAVAPNPASVTITATSAEATSPGPATVNVQAATAVGTYPNVQISATAAGGAAHTDIVTLVVD